MAGETIFTVARLNEYADRVLKNDPRLRSIKVSGEISGFKRHSSGHLYFSLKDSEAVVSCVMFRSSAASLKLDPRDGMKVVAHGSVSIFARDGKYQLYVDSMRADGEGELYRQFLLLKAKLEEEGVFENARPLPVLPRAIGIATSETGAALHDMITVTRRRFPGMNILFAPCQVQGEGAAESIRAALRVLQKFPACDVIIVGRGGGSYEDLYCFNDEALARDIASSKVPVVSAVGHETDFTIADFAADLRAPTPSAAAELCCPVYEELEGGLSYEIEAAGRIVEDRLRSAGNALSRLTGSAAMANPHHAIDIKREKLRSLAERLGTGANAKLLAARAKLEGRRETLKAISPQGVIDRGYAVVTGTDGAIIKDVSGLAPDMRIGLRMAGGRASAVVTETDRG
ncbi:MAG: exodeoxyribonuclease VII large subunit [Clostridiales bacterium]|nr:exodeoxyribonuclease VII large subunit [Clostridiales bacterium]